MSKYEKRFIGGGAFGNVFELVGHNPPAVIKYIAYFPNVNLLTFQRECDILRGLTHPNVVKLIETQTVDDNRLGIIMEYCQRGALNELVFDPTIIYTMRTVVVWGRQLFDVIDCMYRMYHLAHRDIQLENIFVTDDFRLKIGDFGLRRLIERAHSGSFMSTNRYTSPPVLDEKEIVDKQKVFHKNDVYALGLVFWTIIERRMVWDEYNVSGAFHRDYFIADISTGKLGQLEKAICPKDIQEIVERSVHFDRRLRPDAEEIAAKLKENKQFDDLDFTPINESNQKNLLKPIGFNGGRERKPVESLKEKNSSINDSGTEIFHRFLESWSKESICDQLSPQNTQRRKTLIRRLLKLSSEKRETLGRAIPEMIEKSPKDRNEIIKHSNFPEQSKVLDELSPEQLFAFLLVNEFDRQENLLVKVAKCLAYKNKAWMNPWPYFDKIIQFIIVFGQFKSLRRWSKHLLCERYISQRTGQEWFHFDSANSNVFFTKHFAETIANGQWNNEKREIWLYGSDRFPQNYDQLHYFDQKSFELQEMVETLEFHKESLKSIARLHIAKYISIDHSMIIRKTNATRVLPKFDADFPIPGYVFQLRNPPRLSCVCKHRKCSFVNYSLIGSHIHRVLPSLDTLQTPIYDCTSNTSQKYLDAYFAFLCLIERQRQEEKSVPNKAREEEKFLFLTCRLRRKFGCTFLILGDDPANYQCGERIPCYNFDRAFESIGADQVLRYFEETPIEERLYILMNSDETVKVLDYKGEALSSVFKLSDETSWPDLVK